MADAGDLEPGRQPTLTDATRVLRISAVAGCALWLPVLILWGHAPFAVTFDDAFYYFQIGREIAHGHGSTFNGLDHTNGYHPLWQAICVLPYLVGLSGLAAVRSLLVLQLALWAATLWIATGMVGPRLTRRTVAPVAVLVVLIAVNPAVAKVFVNGLESGVAALAYAGLLAFDLRHKRPSALLLVVAFLARTDAVFVIGALLLWSLLLDRRREVLVRFVPVSLVVVTYLLANWLVFGEPLQVSGVIKRQSLTVPRIGAMLVVAAIAAAVAVGARRLGSARFPLTGGLLAGTGWFAAACVLLVGYYQVLSVEVYLWYYAPVALYLLIVLLHVAADFAEAAVADGQSLGVVGAILAAPLALAMVFGAHQLLDPHLRSLEEGDRAAALWVRENTSADTVLASWDAGVVGYFSDRPVVNLDGVVNSFAWVDATHHAPDATRAFLDERNVTLIVNHAAVVDGEDPDIHRNIDALYGPGGADVVQLHREQYTFSGTAGGHSGTRVMATFVYELCCP